jgi:hypothetical protein
VGLGVGEDWIRRGEGGGVVCSARVTSLFSMCWVTEEYGAWCERVVDGESVVGTYPHRERARSPKGSRAVFRSKHNSRMKVKRKRRKKE